jgi:predicted Zn-dependent protease
MRSILASIAVLVALLVTHPASADTMTHKASHISFWVPEGWSVENHEGDALALKDAKDEVGLLLFAVDARDLKGAMAALDQTIDKTVTDVKMSGPAKKVTINGMEASVADGAGKVDGKPVELSVLLVKTPANKFLAIFGAIETSKKKAHEADLRKILASLKPAKA